MNNSDRLLTYIVILLMVIVALESLHVAEKVALDHAQINFPVIRKP